MEHKKQIKTVCMSQKIEMSRKTRYMIITRQWNVLHAVCKAENPGISEGEPIPGQR